MQRRSIFSATSFVLFLVCVMYGYIVDKTHNWNMPFLGSIGLLLFGAVMAFWMKPSNQLPTPAYKQTR